MRSRRLPRRTAGLVLAAVATVVGAACARRGAAGPGAGAAAAADVTGPDATARRAVGADAASLADDAGVASLRQAVERTMPAWARRGDASTPAAARRLVDALATSRDPGTRRDAVAAAFELREIPGPVLMTSYYEPELPVRRARDARFRWPLLRRPHDLVDVDPPALDPACNCRRITAGRVERGRVVPYPTRAEIHAGALRGRRLELAWSDDLLGVFLLQVQGSGRLRLPDGRVLRVRHAGTNGRPYRALGRVMVERGMLTAEEATIPGIRRVFATLPERRQVALLNENPRYAFFAPGDGSGPVGSLGVALTPGRSLAADPAVVAPGSLVWLDMPSLSRFAIVQDTGGGIAGSHVDLFVGAGPDAEAFAGSMRDRGRVFVLVPR